MADDRSGGGFGWFIFGGLVGLAVGAYIASGPGREQIESLRSKTIELSGSEPVQRARDAAQDLGTPADLKLTYFATNRALVVDVDLMPTGAALPMPLHPHATHVDPELQRLAYEMIRCFVDDFRPSIEPRTGHVRFRMVKHLAG